MITRISETLMKMTRNKSLVFFSSMAMQLKHEVDNTQETACTDGTTVFYSQAFVDALSTDELVFLVAHETMHCSLRHMFRMADRDPTLWNMACDYVINASLVAAGLPLPKGGLFDPKYAGMNAEAVYTDLLNEKEKQNQQDSKQGGGGDGGSSGGGSNPVETSSTSVPGASATGTFRAPAGGTGKTDADWQVITEQAHAVATSYGHGSPAIDRLIQSARKTVVDWKQETLEFLQPLTPHDYTYQRFNRRIEEETGIMMPTLDKMTMPRIAVAIDTSGSISDHMLAIFSDHLNTIMQELKPESITVVYCDDTVQGVEEFIDDDIIVLKAKGYGGTAFQPVFDHLENDPPAALIYFTDLYGPPPAEPDYPVLWACISRQEGPFGKTVPVYL